MWTTPKPTPAGNPTKFCHACGAEIDARAEICPKCGVRQIAHGSGKSRPVAALLALFLGGLGIHKFYLGKTVLGVIYLIFCWTFIPSLVAWVEGMSYLATSDESWAQRYGGPVQKSSGAAIGCLWAFALLPLLSIIAIIALIFLGSQVSSVLDKSAGSFATPAATHSVSNPPAATVTSGPASSEPGAADFEPIALKGTGKKVVKFTIPEETAAIADITHKGEENFIVHTVDATGETLAGLVNEIGNYRGTVLFDTGAGEHSVAFEIDADGAWTITVKPVTAAKVWDPSTTLNSTGDGVYLVSPPSSGLVTLNLKYKGEGNFIVHAYSSDGTDGLANEIGDFSGQVLLPDGTLVLEVLASGGTWSATPG
jgi:TM2 domain-containing membrane protein YozV